MKAKMYPYTVIDWRNRTTRLQWSPTGIPRSAAEMQRRAAYGGRKGRKAARLLKRSGSLQLLFTNTPVLEYVTWNVTMVLPDQEVIDLFGETVELIDQRQLLPPDDNHFYQLIVKK